MTLMFQGQVKSKNSRSNKKLRYFVIHFSKFVSEYFPLRLFCDTTDHIHVHQVD